MNNKYICTKCNLEKSIFEFDTRRTGKLGHQSRCKQCRRDENQKHYKKIYRKKPKHAEGTKECTNCKIIKPFNRFLHIDHIDNDNSALVYDTICKSCQHPKDKMYKQTGGLISSRKRKDEFFTNTDQQKLYSHAYKLLKYKLTVKDYDQLLIKQNRVCAICHQPQKNNKYLSVDHVHDSSQKVRGLLCITCNSLISKIEKDITILSHLVDYFKYCVDNSNPIDFVHAALRKQHQGLNHE